MKSVVRQRGVATVLIVLVTALALGALALMLLMGVRGNQERQVMVHASTHSQAGAWSGVELFRRYFQSLSSEQLSALQVSTTPIRATLGDNALSATLVALQAPTSGSTDKAYSLTVDIDNQEAAAQAASIIRVVYSVTPGGAATTSDDFDGTVTIRNDLKMTGGIEIRGGESAKINVDGSATLSSASIVGLKTLKATGDVYLGSNISVEEVFANGTLTLTGSATTLKGSSLGNLTYSSGGSSGVLSTNGDLTISNGSVTTGNALGNIVVSSGFSQGTLTAGKTISISNGSTQVANAVGNITLSSWQTIGQISSQATVTCTSVYWTSFTRIRALATSNCPTSTAVQAPVSVSISLMTPLEAFTVPKPKVDAYELKDMANYVFEAVGSKLRVTVKSVNGLADGVYYLGNYSWQSNRAWQDFLCQEVDSNRNCTLPVKPDSSLRTICQGFSQSNACFSYDSASNTWSISGKNLAPGVMWFEGNLAIQNGNYYDTFLATRGISTGGSTTVGALNYMGYSVVCGLNYPANATSEFAGLYPSNLCDTSSKAMVSNSIGNIALLAGGYVDGTFQGGTINLGASNEIYGSVVAGDLLLTSGSSTVHGYVTAAGQGTGTVNNWSGSTIIDLRNLPSGYDPGDIPSMDDSCESDCDSASESSATVKWVRYL
ncbi:MAG: hypothetical protein GAK45_01806 [Pseudomonas citronellolis]|nr:MAG: hypothetical protein GAK45_01806 [Pseudomonas citronellolis]